VGKTYAMLCEGHRRRERGTDVVVGFVETHGRARTAEQITGLEVVSRQVIEYRGSRFTEMDVDAILRRRPAVVLVDEFAHTNVPGARNAKRWQDVEELLDAGLDVISTLNVQHLESLNDVVERITGVRQRETVPDEPVRRADQIELVDMSAEALRKRMTHGNIYGPDKIDLALSHYFRVGNLTALRELALLWVADRVDAGLARYRDEHGITETWETRERVVVGLTGGEEGDTLIRRAARVAARLSHGDLVAVNVTGGDVLTAGSAEALARQRALVESLGGSYHQVAGDDVPTALLDFARSVNATQIVLGTSRRPAWRYVLEPGVGRTVIDRSGDIDVHMVTHEQTGKAGLRWAGTGMRALSRRRRVAGWVLTVLGPAGLAMTLTQFRAHIGLASDLLMFLALTVLVAMVGGLWPAVVAAVAGSLLVNWFFTPPEHTLTIAEPANAFALAISVVTAVAVSTVVHQAAQRRRQAGRAQAEAGTLSLLATNVLRGERTLPSLLEQVRETFGLISVALLEHDDAGGWQCAGSAGPAPCSRPEQSDTRVPVSDDLVLALRGRTLPASDRRVLSAFAHQAAAALDRQRLAEEARRARRLAESDKVRTALLAAVSHDLRNPLSSIKASVGSLRQTDVDWDPADEIELLATIEESADRLDGLIANLLDMTRLQTGTVAALPRPVGLDEIVPAALAGVPEDRVKVDVPETLPMVDVDPGLLERAVANVVENAVRHSTAPVLVTAGAARFGTVRPGRDGEWADRIELRVVDHGPGVPGPGKEQIFAPFRQVGDPPRARAGEGGGARSGVGLGLAVARGFTEAVGGTLTAEDTPAGGLTLVFSLPMAHAGGAVS
jgi:two-component system sensor histidine kinase KdpD